MRNLTAPKADETVEQAQLSPSGGGTGVRNAKNVLLPSRRRPITHQRSHSAADADSLNQTGISTHKLDSHKSPEFGRQLICSHLGGMLFARKKFLACAF